MLYIENEKLKLLLKVSSLMLNKLSFVVEVVGSVTVSWSWFCWSWFCKCAHGSRLDWSRSNLAWMSCKIIGTLSSTAKNAAAIVILYRTDELMIQ